jgi:hypothetical protein
MNFLSILSIRKMTYNDLFKVIVIGDIGNDDKPIKLDSGWKIMLGITVCRSEI